jgi:preprotein translocase subunit SecG
MAILVNILLVVFVLVALLMILVILMQRPKSEGLGAAFGGGVTENIFGAQTTNVLTKITGWLAGIFFTLTFTLSVLYAHRTITPSGLRQELMKEGNTAAFPGAQPSPAPAVGAPGTVTSPTPAGDLG